MTIQYSGGWEKSDERYICRWFIAYNHLGSNEIAGIVGGYSGGGGFIEERFFARTDGNQFKALFIDYTEYISGDEKDFDEHPSEVTEAAEKALDLLMEFHDEDLWFDDEQLVLNDEKLGGLIQSEEMYIGGDAPAEIVRFIADKTGLIAGPKVI